MGNTNFHFENQSDFDTSCLKLKIPLKKQMVQQYRFFDKPFFEHKLCSAWKAEIRKTKKLVVIKKMSKTDKNFLKEIFILMKIDHPNIIQIFEFFQSPNNYFIVYPFFEALPVLDFFIKNSKILDKQKKERKISNKTKKGSKSKISSKNEFNTKKEIESIEKVFDINLNLKLFIKELLITVSYLHQNGVSHRDIVPKYVLWNGKNLNLCGFTKSGIFQKNKLGEQKENFTKKTNYNLYFTSPEMLKCDYTYKNDIWNCGILIYLLIFGKTPFNGKMESEIKENIFKQKIIFSKKKKIDDNLKILISSMLEKDYNKRLEISELLKFDFFKKKKQSEFVFNNPMMNENSFISLKKFNKKSKCFSFLKKYITQKILSKSEKSEISKLFKKLDKNSDGILDEDELSKVQGSTLCFIDEKQIKEFIKKNDINKNGVIEYSEFLGAMINLRILKKKEILEQFFHLLDRDQKGYFGFKDFKEVLGYKENEKIVKKTFKKYADKDYMDKERFVKFLEYVIEEYCV